MGRPKIELEINQEFERLTVKAYVGQGRWLCECTCGKTKEVRAVSLKKGHTRSCGCLHNELLAKRNTVHGMSDLPEYTVWACMRDRCYRAKNKLFRLYGGKGVKIHPSWESFETFLKDVGPRPSPKHVLDRIDGNGNYEPGNVRWATPLESGRNTSRNRLLTWNGETKPVSEWAELQGIAYCVLYSRLGYGWSVEKSLTTPVSKIRQRKTRRSQ